MHGSGVRMCLAASLAVTFTPAESLATPHDAQQAQPDAEAARDSAARFERAGFYATPVVLFAGSRAVGDESRDVSRMLEFAGWSTLLVPAFTARNTTSTWLGLGAGLVAGGSTIASRIADEEYEAPLLGAGLIAYTGLSTLDIGWFAVGPLETDFEAGASTRTSHGGWYGWRPALGYALLVGGIWVSTVDRVGVNGSGYMLASSGLMLIPIVHARAGRPGHGLLALGATLASAGAGAAVACASGCSSAYDLRGRGHGVLEPGRAVIGATAGIASWAVIDSVLLSRRASEERPSTRSLTAFVSTSPTTGRPRLNASAAF